MYVNRCNYLESMQLFRIRAKEIIFIVAFCKPKAQVLYLNI